MFDTEEALRVGLQDPQTRASIIELLTTGGLLHNCIIDKNYRISDRLVSPIRLTPLGHEIWRGCLDKNRRLKPNEAKLAVFLRFGCPDGLLVDLGSDIDTFRRIISEDVRARKIQYPYILVVTSTTPQQSCIRRRLP
jgi:hypothetical protein